MNTIIHHNDLRSMNTFNSNLKQGDINPLLRKSYKQLININTRFRNNYTTTTATNFGFTLPTPIKKVVTMRVVDVQVPKMVYTVSSILGSNKFVITQAATTDTIAIPNGSYSGVDMAAAITTTLVAAGYTNISASFDKTSGKITFSDSTLTFFNIDFGFTDASCNQFSQTGSNLYKDQLTLGWMLGFRQNYKYLTPLTSISTCDISNTLLTDDARLAKGISRLRNGCLGVTQVKNNGYRYFQQHQRCFPQQIYPQPMDISLSYIDESSYTGEALYDSHGSKYFLLSINDFQNNHNITVVSPLQQETLGDGNILAKVSSECCNKCCVEHTDRMYFGPTDITKLHIILYDEYGRIVDLNNGDYSFTLEIEVLYDL